MDQQYAKELLKKYRSGTCQPHEQELVENWITFGEFPEFEITEEELKEELGSLSNALPLHKETHLWKRISIAAALAIAVIGATLWHYTQTSNKNVPKASIAKNIIPGKVGATLTLANGKKIKLSDAVNGEIANEVGVSVTKMQNGQLMYQFKSSSKKGATKNAVNTLSTGRGETYILVLPDHSKVWLNAASSITYSTNLVDSKGVRQVQLQGEAYFEVFKDKRHPFIVNTDNQRVEVLGTHFNINSYADEAVTATTLLEGSVKISTAKFSRLLKPNQQALQRKDGNVEIREVNTDDVVAWKDGYFIFEDETLENIMLRVSRWYDVEVDYAKDVDKHKLYGGGVSRYDDVSTVLEILESTKNIHFKIEGRKIMVLK
ncbi:hypothetical protein OC25_09770 [Pedobacter kyungheensis]|uniref:Anti-sigma factor n=1 Tax=Pedobacter kyungheensis TaxID=1069985 RepID=A0A0C1FMM8_9SPHI|nr:FecR domain-containing protein [Pedobacter kyungheensis]KIA94217.1 hypothetical protein OC25_09770 [Pedobacter kyungheensis]